MTSDALSLFVKALALGLLIAGLATGLGAACADAVYGAVGALGVVQVIDWLVGARLWLALGGGAMLLWMAWRIVSQPLATQAAALPTRADLLRCFAGTFVLTLSNPATILSFIAVFTAMAGGGQRTVSAAPMIAGVLLGSALWWLTLSTAVGYWRQRFSAVWRRRINQLSGALLAGFAVWQWASVWMGR